VQKNEEVYHDYDENEEKTVHKSKKEKEKYELPSRCITTYCNIFLKEKKKQ
jgi:hypothetical protein